MVQFWLFIYVWRWGTEANGATAICHGLKVNWILTTKNIIKKTRNWQKLHYYHFISFSLEFRFLYQYFPEPSEPFFFFFFSFFIPTTNDHQQCYRKVTSFKRCVHCAIIFNFIYLCLYVFVILMGPFRDRHIFFGLCIFEFILFSM